MKNQKIRSMKVHEQSGYNYKATPTIILKGQWLKEMGFEIGDYITVSCEDGKLIITPDAALCPGSPVSFPDSRTVFQYIRRFFWLRTSYSDLCFRNSGTPRPVFRTHHL